MRNLNSLIRNIDAFTRYPIFFWDTSKILWEMSLILWEIHCFRGNINLQMGNSLEFIRINNNFMVNYVTMWKIKPLVGIIIEHREVLTILFKMSWV